MSKAVKIVIAIIVVAAIVVAAVVIAKNDSNKTNDNKTNSTKPTSQKPPGTEKSSGGEDSKVAATIAYNGEGFSPEVTTIKAGDAVTVANKSHDPLDFGSDPHPTHTDQPELNAGDINPGQSKTFTVTKKGTWGFHNHFDPSQHGKIEAQ